MSSGGPDDDLTDDHMRVLQWLGGRPGASIEAAAEALGLGRAEVEAFARRRQLCRAVVSTCPRLATSSHSMEGDA